MQILGSQHERQLEPYKNYITITSVDKPNRVLMYCIIRRFLPHLQKPCAQWCKSIYMFYQLYHTWLSCRRKLEVLLKCERSNSIAAILQGGKILPCFHSFYTSPKESYELIGIECHLVGISYQNFI